MSASFSEDETLYKKEEVRITRTLLEIDGTQYQIRNIDTVKIVTKKPDRSQAWNCFLIGVLMLIACVFYPSLEFFLVTLIVIGLGINWLISLKDTHTLLIATTGGNQTSYSSENLEEIKAIRSALEAAMARLA
ncbi:DUF6232 family protein [Argonema antarcticum]|uniref:DUF6232 family protein n=1 Tax=Argonema antarcticum TaxID=2942763 RepID=UPI0020136764|nr:DUF6232 family protein [Argonema antarcticum]MCL1473348.1 DUF6232 family protein [Argonema antarcticum A004/B2]